MRLHLPFPLLSLLPTLHVHACRSTPLLTHFDALRPQSFPPLALSNFASARFVSGSSPQQEPIMSARAGGGGRGVERFAYKVGAAFSGKGRKFDPQVDSYTFNDTRELDVENKGKRLEEEVFTGRPAAGQDAFFVSVIGSSLSPSYPSRVRGRDVAFGVADGVGGWADSGVDSADFSHGLCRAMVLVAAKGKKMGPRELLEKAYRDVVEGGEVAGGGSTACVAVGGAEGVLNVANLGDSGFMQLRPSAVHYSSNPQTHAFNTPFQLSIVPPKVLLMSKAFGGGPLSDMPSAADVSAHSVRHGDVLVFATDGVWDNISPEELLKVVSRRMMSRFAWVNKEGRSEVGRRLVGLTDISSLEKGKAEHSIQTDVAAAVVREAKAASLNKMRNGPFAREVQEHYPAENWRGGKVDDICVVVAIVVDEKNGRRNVGKPKL